MSDARRADRIFLRAESVQRFLVMRCPVRACLWCLHPIRWIGHTLNNPMI